jgi:hypothetical protein
MVIARDDGKGRDATQSGATSGWPVHCGSTSLASES